MIWAVSLGIILGISFLAAGGIAIWGIMDDGVVRKWVGGILCPILFILFLCLPFSFHQVNSGEVAVIRHMGEVKDTAPLGVSFKFWMTDKYERYDAKVQTLEIVDSAYSKDAQTMDIQMTIQYQISNKSEDVIAIATNYGNLEALSSRIRSVAIEKTKAVLSTHKAMNDSNDPESADGIIENREAVGKEVTESVKEALSGYYITVNTVALTNIDFSDTFEATVEQKMIAEQEQLRAKYEKEKAIIKAEQDLEVAKKAADAALYQAEKDAEAQKAIATAEAYATQIKVVELAKSLGYEVTGNEEDGYIIDWTVSEGDTKAGQEAILAYLKYLEYLSKWNGELPNVVTGSDGTILIPSQG